MPFWAHAFLVAGPLKGFHHLQIALDGYAQLPKTCTGLQSAFAFIFWIVHSLFTSQKHCQIGDVCTPPDDLTNHCVTIPVTSNMPGCNGLLLALVLYTSKSGVTFSVGVFGVLTGKKREKKTHKCREKDKERDGKSTLSIFWICCHYCGRTIIHFFHFTTWICFSFRSSITPSPQSFQKNKRPTALVANYSTNPQGWGAITSSVLLIFPPDFCCCKRLLG